MSDKTQDDDARNGLGESRQGSSIDARILAQTQERPRSVDEIAERTDTCPSTVYRHVNALEERGFLAAEIRISSDGTHYRVYEADVDGEAEERATDAEYARE